MSVPKQFSHPGVYVQEVSTGAPSIVPVDTSTAAFVGRALRGPVDEPVALTSFADFERAFGGPSDAGELGLAVRDFFENGGRRAFVVRAQEPAGSSSGRPPGSWRPARTKKLAPVSAPLSARTPDGAPRDADAILGDAQAGTGLRALDRVDSFQLLNIPPYRIEGVEPRVIREAAAYCSERRAILIVDTPPGWKGDDVRSLGLVDRDNAAVYHPRVRKANPLRGGAVEELAPGGAVAGAIARIDATRGVWHAPAGLDATLAGVDSFAVDLNDAETGELNSRGVNCLRTMPGAGPVVWGARTAAGDDRLASQWKYLSVRRLGLFLEESIERGTRWAVFEPNDEPLWARLRSSVSSFLHGLFRQGAFPGASPKDAYFVRCDATTTTQADVDRGIVNVVVGFAALKPAEFVVLYLQQTTQAQAS